MFVPTTGESNTAVSCTGPTGRTSSEAFASLPPHDENTVAPGEDG